MPIQLKPTFREQLEAAHRSQVGMWVCSGSPLVAEIVAGSGLDWMLLDMEHSPNDLPGILAQLQAVAGYPTTPMVRVATNDTVLLKQVLDLGAQNILVPMVNSAEQARCAAEAVRYPPHGVRGVGAALARSARWGRVEGYLARADELVSLHVQVESTQAVEAAGEIAAVDGVDGIFIGPSDLAATMGFLGQPNHPEVRGAVQRTIDAVRAAGKKVGVNAFDPVVAEQYIASGIDYLLVGADVVSLARAGEGFAQRFGC